MGMAASASARELIRVAAEDDLRQRTRPAQTGVIDASAKPDMSSTASDLDTSFVIVDPDNKPKQKHPLSRVRDLLCNPRAAD